MTIEKNSPHVTPEVERLAEARRRRLAEELRANLGKRKAQARARAADGAGDEAGDNGEGTEKSDGAGDDA